MILRMFVAIIKTIMKKFNILLAIICIICSVQSIKAQELSANAKAEMGKNNFLPAIGELSTFLSTNPDNEPALTYRANFYSRTGQFDKALIDAAKVLIINPKSINALIVSGVAKAGQQKYKDAILDFNSALALQPSLKPALMLRAQAFFKINDYQKAKADLDLVIKNDPKNLEAYLYRARIYATENDFAAAMSDYSFIRENAEPYSKAKETATNELLKTQEMYAKKLEADKQATMQNMAKSLPAKNDETVDKLSKQVNDMTKEMNEAHARLKPLMENFSATVANFSERAKTIPKSDFRSWSAFYKEINPKLTALAKDFEKQIDKLNGKESLKDLKVKLEGGLPIIYKLIKQTSPYADRYQQYVAEANAMSNPVIEDVKRAYEYFNAKDNARFIPAKKTAITSLNKMIDLVTSAKKDLAKFNDPQFTEKNEAQINLQYQDYNNALTELKARNL
ncbi:MAG: tetratricopeptide repeat protein [Pedobacter sp.]|nr:MAG: tetratricopeptide repeat protein [Pedobacter sp.]